MTLEPADSGAAARTPRKRASGTPNTLPAHFAEAVAATPESDFGPAMRALHPKQQAFVLAMYAVKPGHGAAVRAAKASGYGTSTTDAKSWSSIAARLRSDEKIQAALAEEDQKRIRAAAPRAIRALEHLIETPSHRDHGRALGMVLDRVHPVETTHRVEVEHRHAVAAPEDVIARIREIAARVGVVPFGLPAPRVIDGTCEEIATEGET